MATDKVKYILAIDLGTSGPKVALISTQGKLMGHDVEPNPLFLTNDGGAEQNPDDWWTAIMSASKRLLNKGLVDPKDIVGISCTGQWSGTVAIDKEQNHLMNAIIWLDSRGAVYVKEAIRGFIKVSGYSIGKLMKWLRLTGGAPSLSGKDPFAHILYIKNKFPEIYAKTHKFLEPKDYINMRFTGKIISTYDTMTLHWLVDTRDINNVKYDDGLFALSGFDREKFPEMINSTDIVGNLRPEIAKELGLSTDVKIVGGTPDVQTAALGAGAVRDFEPNLCIGTSSFLTCHVGFKKTDALHGVGSIPSGIPGKYIVANEQETAGACINFLKDNIFFPKDDFGIELDDDIIYETFGKLASKVPPGSNGVIFTPWLNGERTPIEDHQVRGGFFNLSLATKRADMIRSVYEGVAYNTRWLLECVEKFTGKTLNPLRIIGGGAKSDVWCQIFADIMNRTINQVENPRHANSRGAAMVALVGLGYATFEEAADQIKIRKSFVPNKENREIYDRYYKIYRTIYNVNRKTYAKLNNHL